jgi:NADH-quinone oxidoreductase subunit N
MMFHKIGATLANLQFDLAAFAPELVLCAGIVVMLVLRLFPGLSKMHLGTVALGICVLAIGLSYGQWQSDQTLTERQPKDIFSGLLAYDAFTVFVRIFLLAFTILTIILSMLTRIPDAEDSGDFYVLLLGATLGMILMASANHLLMVYIAVEMASLPSYALAGFLKGRRQSSEAALKYVVYGGGAAGMMLYGISLVAGRFGTGYLPEVGSSLAYSMSQMHAGQLAMDPILILGLLLILVGMAFKLAAVPFHFWCPDVFEGAAAEVAGFLSVASKGAAVALVGRFILVMIGGVNPATISTEQWLAVTKWLGPALAFFAAVTATFGNLAAYAQTNLKRLLAYSTIAHAGYMMMSLAAMNRLGVEAALFYLVSYLFMNLGAFAVVAFIRNKTGTEDLSGYSGMIHRAPLLTVALAFFLLSLVGLPPLVGYMAKFEIFAALWQSAEAYNNGGLYVLLIIGLVNTVISLVYYVKVLKVMILDPVPKGTDSQPLAVPPLQSAFAFLLAAATAIGIFFWDPIAQSSRRAVSQFHEVRPASKLTQAP